jgi:hypothetical protein
LYFDFLHCYFAVHYLIPETQTKVHNVVEYKHRQLPVTLFRIN